MNKHFVEAEHYLVHYWPHNSNSKTGGREAIQTIKTDSNIR